MIEPSFSDMLQASIDKINKKRAKSQEAFLKAIAESKSRVYFEQELLKRLEK